MAIINQKTGKALPLKVTTAKGLWSRLKGLIGSEEPHKDMAFQIKPCSGIHTFGMSYSIDVLFLDQEGKILSIYETLVPNRITRIVKESKQVLELAPGAVRTFGLSVGDVLKIQPDKYI